MKKVIFVLTILITLLLFTSCMVDKENSTLEEKDLHLKNLDIEKTKDKISISPKEKIKGYEILFNSKDVLEEYTNFENDIFVNLNKINETTYRLTHIAATPYKMLNKNNKVILNTNSITVNKETYPENKSTKNFFDPYEISMSGNNNIYVKDIVAVYQNINMVQVPIYINNIDKINGLETVINFDSNILTYNYMQRNPDFFSTSGITSGYVEEENYVKLYFGYNSKGYTNITEETPLATLTFNIDKKESTTIDVVLNNLKLLNTETNIIEEKKDEANIKDGKLKIVNILGTEIIPGMSKIGFPIVYEFTNYYNNLENESYNTKYDLSPAFDTTGDSIYDTAQPDGKIDFNDLMILLSNYDVEYGYVTSPEPMVGQHGIDPESIELKWQIFNESNSPAANGYNIYLEDSLTDISTDTITEKGNRTTSFNYTSDVGSLNSGKTYYWKAIKRDSSGDDIPGKYPIFYFTTNYEPKIYLNTIDITDSSFTGITNVEKETDSLSFIFDDKDFDDFEETIEATVIYYGTSRTSSETLLDNYQTSLRSDKTISLPEVFDYDTSYFLDVKIQDHLNKPITYPATLTTKKFVSDSATLLITHKDKYVTRLNLHKFIDNSIELSYISNNITYYINDLKDSVLLGTDEVITTSNAFNMESKVIEFIKSDAKTATVLSEVDNYNKNIKLTTNPVDNKKFYKLSANSLKEYNSDLNLSNTILETANVSDFIYDDFVITDPATLLVRTIDNKLLMVEPSESATTILNDSFRDKLIFFEDTDNDSDYDDEFLYGINSSANTLTKYTLSSTQVINENYIDLTHGSLNLDFYNGNLFMAAGADGIYAYDSDLNLIGQLSNRTTSKLVVKGDHLFAISGETGIVDIYTIESENSITLKDSMQLEGTLVDVDVY